MVATVKRHVVFGRWAEFIIICDQTIPCSGEGFGGGISKIEGCYQWYPNSGDDTNERSSHPVV